jgi:hypothetical protein
MGILSRLGVAVTLLGVAALALTALPMVPDAGASSPVEIKLRAKDPGTGDKLEVSVSGANFWTLTGNGDFRSGATGAVTVLNFTSGRPGLTVDSPPAAPYIRLDEALVGAFGAAGSTGGKTVEFHMRTGPAPAKVVYCTGSTPTNAPCTGGTTFLSGTAQLAVDIKAR